MMNRIKENKAFTLLEVLIALAIVVILLAVSMPMVSGISSKMKMKELDNYAKTIYLEAQNLLLEKKAEGSLINFYEELQGSYAGRNLLAPPQDYEGDGWGSLYYLSTDDPLAKEIIPVGTSFDGSYIIELNPMTGDVYGVFYREGSEDIDYGDIKVLSGRNLAERQTAGLGYYGGGSMETEEVVQEYITLDQKVSVVNEEELYVIISYKRSTVLERDFFNENFAIQMKITGLDSNAEAELQIEDEEKLNCQVVGNRREVYVLLDSLLPGGSFNDIIDGHVTTEESFIPGENIKIQIKSVFNNGAYFQSDDATVITNNLFAGRDRETGKIYINALRHLMYLDAAYYEHTGAAPCVVMLKDIDFATTDYKWKVATGKFTYNPNDPSNRPDSLDVFVPLENASVFEAEGAEIKGSKLTNFVIDNRTVREGFTPATDYVGIIEKVSNMKVSGVQIVDSIIDGGNATHVGAFAGAISNSEITNCGVYLTTRNAQMSYYGDMDATIAGKGYANLMDQRYDIYKISGTTSVGGFCGSANDTDFITCFAAVKVSGTFDVGGFCGVATGNSGFASCYASGEIMATEQVGGFVGKSDSSIYSNSYSTAEIMASSAAGGFVGVSENSLYKDCISYAKLTTGPEGISVPSLSGVFYRGKVEGDTNTFQGCKYLNQIGYNSGLVDAVAITASAYGDLKDPDTDNKMNSYPYSRDLIEKAFPFQLVTGQHYGNWQVHFTIDTSLVYYEVYPIKDENGQNRYDEDGELLCEYGYYCVTTVSDAEGEEKEDFTWVLNTLQDKICIEDGYALLTTYYLESFDCLLYVGSKGTPKSMNISVVEQDPENPEEVGTPEPGTLPAILKRQQAALEFKGYEGKHTAETDFDAIPGGNESFLVSGMYLYQLPYELQVTLRNNVDNFYDKLIIYNGMAHGSKEHEDENPLPVIGAKIYNPMVPTTGLTFYYCPHFAKNAINPGILNGMILNSDIWAEQGAIRNPKTVYVRSAKQLNALGRYSYYWNTNGGNGYKDEELSEETGEYKKVKINFIQETDISFSEYVKEYCGQEFDLMLAGKDYSNQVIGKTLTTTEKQFNNNYNGSGKKIIDYRVESKQRFVGLFGEIQDATIENVHMTVSKPGEGYIRSYYNGDGSSVDAWGRFFLGILNLFVDIDYFNAETACVGGLVGLSYLTQNTIQNCSVSGYEVRYIGNATPDVASISVGGLVGTSMSPVRCCAATCDVRADIKGNYQNSVSMGGLLGSAFYSSTTDSYSGGTIDVSLSEGATAGNMAALGVGGISGGVLKVWNNAKAADVTDTTFSNVYSYTRIYVDKDDFSSVGSSFSTWLTSLLAGGQIHDLVISPIVVNKVLFNPYTSRGTYGVKVTASNIKIDEASCVYLDYTSEGMEIYARENIFNYTHYAGEQLKTYDELVAFSFTGSGMGAVDVDNSFPISDELQGKKYPFMSAVTVPEETDVTDPEAPLPVKHVHYGDWPRVLEGGQQLASEYLAYYEYYSDGTFGYYYLDEKEEVHSTLRNDILVTNNTGYVLLKLEKSGAISDLEIPLNHSGESVIYYAHNVTGSITPDTDENTIKYTWEYDVVRVVDGESYLVRSTSKFLYVNSRFAAAISTSDSLGKDISNPFHIRSAGQFFNIGDMECMNAYFYQSASISLAYASADKHESVDIRRPRKGFWGSTEYGTWVYNGGGRKIFGATKALFDTNDGTIIDCVVEGVNAATNALFANKNTGTIENCNVTNSTLAVSGKAIAGFVHTNDGTIKNCNVGAESMPVTLTANGSSVAGFVYTNNGTIHNCQVTASALTATSNSAAGFVYTNSGTVTGSKVVALGQMSKVSIDGTGVSGFVYTNNGTITGCGVYATKNNDTYQNLSIRGEGQASGFAMSNEKNKKIEECFVVAYISGKGNAAGFVGTNGESTSVSKCYANAKIVASTGSAYGFVQENDGSISSCYFTGWLQAKNGAYGFGTNTKDSTAKMSYCYSIFSFEKADENASVPVYGFAEPEEPKERQWWGGWKDVDDSEVAECYFGLANAVTVKSDGRGTQADLNVMMVETHGDNLKQGNKPSQPFDSDLGQDYPYPEIPSLGHIGDWFVP